MTQPPTATPLAVRLRELRQESGATQKDVADALGLGVSSISSYEKGALVPARRLEDYATFVAVRRSRGDSPVPLRVAELTDGERSERSTLLRELRSLVMQDEAESDADLWTFPPGEPIVILCGRLENMTHPYSTVRDPNYTELLTFADLDALLELHGHVRMRNPDSLVRIIRADRLTAADSIASHIIVLGGPGLNEGLIQILDGTALPISQEEHPEVQNGEVFYVAGEDPELPEFAGRGTPRLTGDVALFARLTNPYDSARTLTWCSGIYSRGVLGAVRLLTDKERRDRNGTYLSERFAAATQFGILARVPVVLGAAITPDLQNDDVRLFEWSDAEAPPQPGEARPDGEAREATR
jgi:transcriptional regulator with XRE-family HTH domain